MVAVGRGDRAHLTPLQAEQYPDGDLAMRHPRGITPPVVVQPARKESSRLLDCRGPRFVKPGWRVNDRQPVFHKLADTSISGLIEALKIDGSPPVLLVLGGAARLRRTVAHEFERTLRLGVVPLLAQMGSIVITGGTDSGVMRSVGEVFGELGQSCRLIGVAPQGKIIQGNPADNDADQDRVRPAPNHDDIVLAQGDEWGCELDALVDLTERLSEHSSVLVLIVGGGDHTADELSRVRERGWPVLILTGSGGRADRIYRNSRFRYSRQMRWISSLRHLPPRTLYRAPRSNPETHDQTEFRKLNDHRAIRRSIHWRFQGEDRIVRLAWERVAAYEELAQKSRPRTKWTVRIVLILGVLTTITGFAVILGLAPGVLQYALVVLPFSSTAVLGMATRRKRHSQWILVRLAAESLKQEIYRYRCKIEPYRRSRSSRGHRSREEELAVRLEALDNRLMMDVPTAVARSAPIHWPPGALDGAAHHDDLLLDDLGVADYVRLRIRHQLNYLDQAVRREDRSINRSAMFMVLLALVAVLVAAVSTAERGWGIAMAASIAAASTAVAASVAYGQSEQRLSKLTSAAAGLRVAYTNFLSCLEDGRTLQVSSVVGVSEEALAQESEDWYRSLQQSIGMFSLVHGR
jgi:hypothetical protein